jgi:hypothetical protein
MIIRVEILAKKHNEKIVVEKKGNNRVATLLGFYAAVKKYANKEHSILKLSSDDPTILTEFGQRYPDIHMELLESSSSSSSPQVSQ